MVVLVVLSLVLAACTLPPTTPGTAGFPNGVAAGDVTADGAILWTRTAAAASVDVEVYDNVAHPSLPLLVADTTTPVFTASATTSAADDFTAKIPVTGLLPYHIYFFRFFDGGEESQMGRFVTAPAAETAAGLRLAYAGDADGLPFAGPPAFNNFEVLNAARGEQPHLFSFLGDTIYSDSGQEPSVAMTLAEYRARHEHNRSFAHLRNLMSATGTIAQPDDHEVHNDYDGATVDPTRYANGWQAFHDWMPTDTSNVLVDPTCAGNPRYLTQKWGSEVEIFLLDERSCRSESATVESVDCETDLAPTAPTALRLAAGLSAEPPEGCLDAIFDTTRTMLGEVQKAQFKADLAASTAKWKIVLSQLAWQQFWALPYDRWEGYGAERNELLNYIRDNSIEDVVFLTTDNHATIMNEVFIDLQTDPEPIAYEAINGPIATNTFEQEVIDFAGPELVPAFQAALSALGVDCRAIDTYAYGLVEVNPASGELRVTAKDSTAKVISDDVTPATKCTKVLT
jgi:phosphodiesterase/alkaline phosphatase D-like protein